VGDRWAWADKRSRFGLTPWGRIAHLHNWPGVYIGGDLGAVREYVRNDDKRLGLHVCRYISTLRQPKWQKMTPHLIIETTRIFQQWQNG
jgi:hypothetical protein